MATMSADDGAWIGNEQEGPREEQVWDTAQWFLGEMPIAGTNTTSVRVVSCIYEDFQW
jgi:hypothetical protein